ncbi:DUF4468 domain-containing protein [Bacteroides sp. 214]|uniref:DUF4468 domain-containing protein n=1 Tax=Bacteroides sp. 214 TaxID=2302935 RepID=UPI0013D56D21|nr:DUF4468 domain-containing protein [Bacteroides sp. 214]NDW11412.1 DUF4468 domain-containing protein [Bacteroides sp. 214]
MKRIAFALFALLVCLPTLVFAQDNKSKYLAGAVPVVDGRIVFSEKIDLPGASKEQIYERMYSWVDERMKANKNNSRILLSDKEKGQIVAFGEEYIVFASSALSLDRAFTTYQMVVDCKDAQTEITIEKIRFAYEKERFPAEEYIVDEVALNKDKTKIIRGYSKFRIKTVDFADNYFEKAKTALGITKVVPVQQVTYVGAAAPTTVTTPEPVATSAPVAVSAPVATPAPVVVAEPMYVGGADLSGYKKLDPQRIPGNIIKMLNEDWMLITAGTDAGFNMMTASWGGMGVLYGKPVTMCFINPTRYTYQLMEKNDTYTLTFYTEAYRDALKYCGTASGRNEDKVKGSGLTPITTPDGSKAFAEAWLVIECRKLVSQSLSHDALGDEKLKEQWMGKQLHKMYIGEIINVWVK